MLQQSVDRLAAPAAADGGTSVLTYTLLILAAVLCFMLRVLGLTMVARCAGRGNPAAFFIDAPGSRGIVQGDQEEGAAVAAHGRAHPAEFASGEEVCVLPSWDR